MFTAKSRHMPHIATPATNQTVVTAAILMPTTRHTATLPTPLYKRGVGVATKVWQSDKQLIYEENKHDQYH